jgi:hypothetical protein
VAGGVVEVLRARPGVDREQFVDARHQANGDLIPRAELDRLVKLSPGMRPTTDVHHPRPAHLVVRDLAVNLENALEPAQKLSGAGASPPQPEVEHRAPSRPRVWEPRFEPECLEGALSGPLGAHCGQFFR